MTTVQMITSNAGEICHLFEVMKKYNATCSLEFKTFKSVDPLIGISNAPVRVEYFEGDIENGGDSVIVYFGEAEFSFDLKSHQFSRLITSCQIDICIASDDYSVWFSSDVISPEGLIEAGSYDEHYSGENLCIVTDEHEAALIEFIRTLCMEDLLDAFDGLSKKADKALDKAAHRKAAGDKLNADGFTERSENLIKLATLLGSANLDYRNHIDV